MLDPLDSVGQGFASGGRHERRHLRRIGDDGRLVLGHGCWLGVSVRRPPLCFWVGTGPPAPLLLGR